MNSEPFEKSPFKAQPFDVSSVEKKAGPLKPPVNTSVTPFNCAPGVKKIFKNIPFMAGTLNPFIKRLILTNDGTNRFPKQLPFMHKVGFLKQFLNRGLTQPLNKLLMCLVHPLKQAQPLGMLEYFHGVTFMRMDGSFKQPMNMNMDRSRRWELKKVVGIKPPNKYIPIGHRVAMGCVSGMGATMLVHPLDVVKIRMQLFPRGRTTIQMLRRILDCEGTRALYAGLTAGLLRQATYTTTRLAVYLTLLERYQKKHDKIPPLSSRLQIAITAGLAGAFAGTPSEVALIRMTVEGRLRRSACSPNCSISCKKVRTTSNAITMLYRLACKEGVPVIWRGATPTLIRSWFVSTAVVGTYGEIQRHLRACDIREGFPLHASTAVFSSFITALMSSPVDVVKTQYQIRKTEATIPEIFKKILREKGLKYFWKGFTPYYIRLTIHTMITYFLMDYLADVYLEARRVMV